MSRLEEILYDDVEEPNDVESRLSEVILEYFFALNLRNIIEIGIC